MAPDITHALRTAPARYAAGVDRRDTALFLSAFEPDGVLWIAPRGGPGSEPRVLRGHGELSQVIERIGRYDRTFHVVGQTLMQGTGDSTARAETYCVAHHWLTDGDRLGDTVLYIRYEDAYRLGDDGEWRFTERRLHEDGREARDVPVRRAGAVTQ